MLLQRGLSLRGEKVEEVGRQDIKRIRHGTAPTQECPATHTGGWRRDAPAIPNPHGEPGPNLTDKRSPSQPLLFPPACAATCARLWQPDICPRGW